MLKETVRRLQFWILQITGALDIEEDPSKVSFPNEKTCRELDRLKKEVEILQEKCKECHSKNQGETNPRFLYWKREWIHSSEDSRPLWND